MKSPKKLNPKLKPIYEKDFLIILLVGIVFFFIYSYFIFDLPFKFNSPDETANYFFAQSLALENEMKILEPLNFIADNRIHPRSITVVNGYLVPVSFAGMTLIYGFIAKILGTGIIIYLTPFFGVLAGLAFYELNKRIFGRTIAFWSGLLFFIHPAFWYYTSRSMYHNTLFVAFIIFSAFFLVLSRNKPPWSSLILIVSSGLCLGLAISIRTSEIWWLGLSGLVIFFFYFKKIDWFKMLIFLTVTFLVLIPFLYTNQLLYNSPIKTGYQVDSGSASPQDDASPSNKLINLILPFGFNLKSILNNFLNYYIIFFSLFTVLILVGFVFLAVRVLNRRAKLPEIVYFCLFSLITLWLVIYYGSGRFVDNPDPTKISIGNSYIRYWLPSFILGLPLVAGAIKLLSSFFKKFTIRRVVVLIIFLFLISFSFLKVFYNVDGGLIQVKKNLIFYNQVSDEVKKITEPEAVIIVDRADKLFFPERKVTGPLRDEATYNLMPRLVQNGVPLYYYGITFPEEHFERFNSKLEVNDLKAEKIKIFKIETLYRIVEL